MPPGGAAAGGGGEHGSTVQNHPPATDDDAPPHSTPPLPEASEDVRKKQQQPAPSLPEGALVEILSRVPYRSLCRFKSVSKPWLALCSAPDIRKRSPQTLSGFFYHDEGHGLRFRNLNGRGRPQVDPSLPFLRTRYGVIVVVQHVSGGLLLCSCSNNLQEFYYVVCNPATEECTVLPPMGFPGPDPIAFLGFDAAVPSRFVVFAPQPSMFGVDGSGEVAIYSSETGRWTRVQSKWTRVPRTDHGRDTQVFLNGTIHLRTMYNTIATVDVEGKVWREIQMPNDLPNICDVGQSQGRLYAWQTDNFHDCHLYIWVLEDYDTGKWALKHTINVLELFGRNCRKDGESYAMFAVHPDCNMIFLTDKKNMTLSYDMDNQKVHVICTEGMMGLPYVPCFAELASAGH
ncbi:F-box protein At5g49610-like [Hordeum vulgare subsp. vulgare]|uniref:F-box domain-containing protein n=1 Tax=Hordeum vulgare subsp. vulgare TaxID=112509 RepID=A0A8I6W840_HORVV|nr:F-box protein At5g49610-like [Hordeum vulgare subsp. vulgare]